jgi:ABC-type cobalamin transport system ATPase subunit
MQAGKVLAAGAADEILTAQRLTQTYGVPVQVVEAAGRRIIVS